MTKALIVIGAALAASCSQAVAPAPRTSEPRPMARKETLPAATPTRAPAVVTAAARLRRDSPTIETQEAEDEIARADAEDLRVIAELNKALALYQAFITRAGDDPVYAEAVMRSKERIADIQDGRRFIVDGIKERRR